MKFLKLITLVLVLATASQFANAQCNAFTKKKCLPTLAPYIHNGQLNSTMLASGETAELMISFYAGQDYRLTMCAQEVLAGAHYRLLDAQHNQLFNSKDAKQNTFDFNVKTTQQLIIEVIVPKAESKTEIVEQGCISILVGFKK